MTLHLPGRGTQRNLSLDLMAGDLDRDGKLDLLLNDVAYGYRRFSWDLYLSTLVRAVMLLHVTVLFLQVCTLFVLMPEERQFLG